MLEKPGSKLGIVLAIFGAAGGIVTVAQWAELNDEWRFGIIGFILGVALVLISGIFVLDNPYRREKLARERKKMDLIKTIPSRADYLHKLTSEAERLQIELDHAKTEADQQRRLADKMYSDAPDIIRNSSEVSATKREKKLRLLEHEYNVVRAKQARVAGLTDEEWRSEQIAKISDPD